MIITTKKNHYNIKELSAHNKKNKEHKNKRIYNKK